jgi:hypothetical protein
MSLAQKFLEVQCELNKKLAEDWKDKGWAYPDAMFTEATEAYNHLNWEWWRSVGREIDWDQVKLEVVGIAHFLFSEVIVSESQDFFQKALDAHGKNFVRNDEISVPELKMQIKQFIWSVLEYDQYKNIGWSIASEKFQSAIVYFFNIIASLELTIEEFYSLFIGKVCLNQHRWKNGYKKGIYDVSNPLEMVTEGAREKYIKQWDGREDNVWLSNYAVTLDPNDPDFKSKLETALDAKYKEVYDSVWNK